jgi:MtrB/PioB family decaheme-associated outer membrane protein
MRTMSALALAVLVAALDAGAQTPPTKPEPPNVPSLGELDLGFRGGTVDGDEARFERYRDLREGAASFFQVKRHSEKYRFEGTAFNAGYRDQRFAAEYTDGKLTVGGLFDSVPMNFLYDAPLIWKNEGGGRFTLPAALRTAVQGPTNVVNDGTAVGVPCAPGLGPTTCNASTAAQAIANRSVYNSIIAASDMAVKREVVGVTLDYVATPALGFMVDFSSTGRTGVMPWSASFAFNNVNQLLAPIDQRNNELKANTEWVNPKGMIRLDYWGSYFANDIQTLTWDNPIRATDFTNGLAPPAGPFDPSAYSNGNGAAFGQAALWPSNTLNAFGLTGMLKTIPKTTINGNVQLTYMRQNESLLPWSVNSTITSPAVLAFYPGLRSLPRTTAEAAVNGLNALVNVNSRPTKYLTLQARYRYNQHDNNTPHFDGRTYVTFDGAVRSFTDDPLTEHIEGLSEYFHIIRKNFDANATFRLRDYGAFRVGYANEKFDREGRGFSEVNDDMLRLAYDAQLFERLSVRASFDQSRRRGEGFILSGIDYETGPAGTQPGLRYYDEADRDRTRSAVILTATPIDQASIFVQFSTTRDTFLGDASIPAGREQFGLLSQDADAIVGGVDVSPSDVVHVGVSFARDEFAALQKSRNANPPPDPSWTDPARNWTLDNNEVVKTYMAYVDLLGVANAKADVRFSYEFNDSDNAFTYGGPRIPVLQAAGTFVPLPNVTNEWQRFTADVKYYFTPKVGVGLGFWYDKFDVSDWNTIDSNGPVGLTAATGTPRIDWLGGLLTGYGNRPYEGSRVFARLLYRF